LACNLQSDLSGCRPATPYECGLPTLRAGDVAVPVPMKCLPRMGRGDLMTEIRHMRSSLAMALALILTVFAAQTSAQTTGTSAQTGKPAKQGKDAPAQAPINLNTATAAELEALPGVGPATAARIVEYRQKQGAFKKIEDLMNVRGVGEKMFLSLKPMIVVTPGKGVWL